MSFEYSLITTGSGIAMAMWTVHVLDYKWNKSTVFLAYITGILLYAFMGIIYFNFSELVGGVLECLLPYPIIFLFAKGNVWRNYIIIFAGFTLQGAICSLFYLAFETVGTAYENSMAGGQNLTVNQAASDFIVRILVAVLIAFIFSKIFKKKYVGQAVVYKIIAFLYPVAALASYCVRRGYVGTSGTEGHISLLGLVIINVVSFLLFGWAFGSLYNWFEAKRLEREQTKLKALIQDNYERLEQELVKPITGQNLSGNLVVDAVIAGYNDFLKAKGIVFESMVQESEGLENVKVDVVMILDYLLSIASHASENVESDSFVWLSIRTIHNSIFVRLDFSKAAEMSFRRIGGWHINRELRQMGRKLDTVSKVAESHEGIMRIKDKEDECEVNLVLMR